MLGKRALSGLCRSHLILDQQQSVLFQVRNFASTNGKKIARKRAAEAAIQRPVFTPRLAFAELRNLDKQEGKKASKFVETVEVAVDLHLDVRKQDQTIRRWTTLPHNHGRERVRVIVFAEEEQAQIAKEAGADVVGFQHIIARIKSKELKLKKTDNVLCHPDCIKAVKKELSKILGPKGLLPQANRGTVTDELASAVEKFKFKVADVKTSKQPQVLAGIGKVNFDDDILMENFASYMRAVADFKPSGAKGKYITKVSISTTQARDSIEVDKAYADPSSALFMREEVNA